MAPNNRRRKIKSDAVCRQLLREKGDKHPTKSKPSGSEFHELPHLFQETPQISDFVSGDQRTKHIQSILERNALDEFLETSLASQDEFSNANSVRILVRQSDLQLRGKDEVACTSRAFTRVPVPRRPINYVSGVPEKIVSAAELTALEEKAFLKWRLLLSGIEEKEGRVMTPFERNLQFWRQLWRVLERSNVVFEIVDARNPLFYRSEDLEAYVSEIHASKTVILLLNKSDLVPQPVRQQWAEYFRSLKVPCLFFSALEELDRQANDSTYTVKEHGQPCNSPDVSSRVSDNNCDGHLSCSDAETSSGVAEYLWQLSKNGDILNGDQLLSVMEYLRDVFFRTRALAADNCFSTDGFGANRHEDVSDTTNVKSGKAVAEPNERTTISSSCATAPNDQSNGEPSLEIEDQFFVMRRSDEFTVGLVGYPNVGKSSIINSVLGHKAVSVSRQPGKTKHFQTIPLPSVRLTLCDCPGLVFPQIVSTRSHLVVNGVSPIDHMRGNFTAPVQLICDRLNAELFRHYNVGPRRNQNGATSTQRTLLSNGRSGSKLSAREFLTTLALSRHQIAGGKGGVPQLFEMAKMVLRDYCIGKLLHWELPPGALPQSPTEEGTLNKAKATEALENNAAIQTERHLSTKDDKEITDEDSEDDAELLEMAGEENGSGISSLNNVSVGKGAESAVTKRKMRHMQKQQARGRNTSKIVYMH